MTGGHLAGPPSSYHLNTAQATPDNLQLTAHLHAKCGFGRPGLHKLAHKVPKANLTKYLIMAHGLKNC